MENIACAVYLGQNEIKVVTTHTHNGLYADLCGGNTQHNNTESQNARL